jgi:hypothetical protein
LPASLLWPVSPPFPLEDSHSSVCVDYKLNFDLGISDAKWFSIAIPAAEPTTPYGLSCVRYLALGLEKTATWLRRIVMPSGRFDGSVAGFVKGHFAAIIEHDRPDATVNSTCVALAASREVPAMKARRSKCGTFSTLWVS